MFLSEKKKKPARLDYLNMVNEPFRNKSLKNIKKEKWLPVPGLEDAYHVSNYGRIKSLTREIHYSNGKIIHKKERIILAGISPAPNYHTKDYSYQLGICFHYERKKYPHSLARLVYHCFVEELKGAAKTKQVIPIDGNGLNCHYKNLAAVSFAEKQKRIYNRKRNITCFSWLDMKEIVKKDIPRRCQTVTQYSQKGKRIKIFKSIKQAAAATGSSRPSISAVICGHWQSAGGFVWKRGSGPARIDLTGYFDQWKKGYKEKRGKKITQYSLSGLFIASYPSITDAAHTTGIPFSNISRMLSGELKTAGGFIWKPV